MNRVREIRERRQFELATLAERVGVSERLLSALEEDSAVASVDVAVRLAAALRFPVDELFFVAGIDGKRIVLSREKSNRLETDSGTVAKKVGEVDVQTALSGASTETPPKNVAIDAAVRVDDKTSADVEIIVAPSAVSNDSPPKTREPSPRPKKRTLLPKISESATLFETAPPAISEGAASSETAPKKVAAPTKSQTRSSAESKTADEEGLATSPPGLRDPAPDRPIRFFDLFCGIGGFRFAAERTFAKMGRDAVCALSCDFDVPAQRSYSANFGSLPVGDVAKLPSEEIPDFDVLFAGFPCQAFSIIGLRKGFADETKGSLFFQIARILRDKRPRAFVLENVRQLTTHDGGRTFSTILRILQEELGYCVDWRIINALDCGLPQKRERVAIVGSLDPFEIAWPKRKTDGKTLVDVLENDVDVDKKYFASPEIVRRRKEAHRSDYFPSIWHENKSGHISSYPYSCALRAGASYNYLLVNGERRLTPRELLRLQGFPDSFKIVVSDSQLRKQAGNAAPVDLIERVLDRFLPLIFPTNATAAPQSS